MPFLRAIPYCLMVLATVVILKKNNRINSYFPSPGFVAGEISLLCISMGYLVLFSE